MATELDHSFSTTKSIDESFAAITDLERVVPAVEGGSVTEVVEPGKVKAEILMRMGATSTVPISFIDIAPIFRMIWALTDSGPVVSSTLPPSTAGTTRSRSVIAAKLSSIDFVVEKE